MIRVRRLNERPHTDDEIKAWVDAYVNGGTVKDYQMAAWLMAVCLNGLTPRETATLTACMVASGVQLQWDSSSSTAPSPEQHRLPFLVDKHSTGGKERYCRLLANLLLW
jgi:pyrimidine-nucleoside phosphorylase